MGIGLKVLLFGLLVVDIFLLGFISLAYFVRVKSLVIFLLRDDFKFILDVIDFVDRVRFFWFELFRVGLGEDRLWYCDRIGENLYFGKFFRLFKFSVFLLYKFWCREDLSLLVLFKSFVIFCESLFFFLFWDSFLFDNFFFKFEVVVFDFILGFESFFIVGFLVCRLFSNLFFLSIGRYFLVLFFLDFEFFFDLCIGVGFREDVFLAYRYLLVWFKGFGLEYNFCLVFEFVFEVLFCFDRSCLAVMEFFFIVGSFFLGWFDLFFEEYRI